MQNYRSVRRISHCSIQSTNSIDYIRSTKYQGTYTAVIIRHIFKVGMVRRDSVRLGRVFIRGFCSTTLEVYIR